MLGMWIHIFTGTYKLMQLNLKTHSKRNTERWTHAVDSFGSFGRMLQYSGIIEDSLEVAFTSLSGFYRWNDVQLWAISNCGWSDSFLPFSLNPKHARTCVHTHTHTQRIDKHEFIFTSSRKQKKQNLQTATLNKSLRVGVGGWEAQMRHSKREMK